MKKYISTRDASLPVSPREAMIRGLSPEGGLYLPAEFPAPFPRDAFSGLSYQETAVRIIRAFFDDLSEEQVRSCVYGAYDSKFDTENIVPLTKSRDAWIAELWHGPTSAFKDLALTILPRLLRTACRMEGISDTLAVLTATSGDTGKAALSGFEDVEGTFVTVFYPEKGVSEIQKLQMQTAKGGNVRVIAVNGNFDDCQRMVKRAASELSASGIPGVRITSANSINIGRLIPQIVYYYTSYEQLAESGAVRRGDPVDFAVPTGNFGDILAGYFAMKTGLPVRKLICASNRNHVLADFLNSGVYDVNRPFCHTMSPSMDILVSSNLERLLFIESGYDEALVRRCMDELKINGRFTVPREIMDSIRAVFTGVWSDEDDCRKTMRDLFEQEGILIDPHTAVAYHAMKEVRGKDGGDVPCIVLSTASAFKFASDVYESLGGEKTSDGFAAMRALSALTGKAVPKQLSELKDLPVRFREVTEPEEGIQRIRTVLEEAAND